MLTFRTHYETLTQTHKKHYTYFLCVYTYLHHPSRVMEKSTLLSSSPSPLSRRFPPPEFLFSLSAHRLPGAFTYPFDRRDSEALNAHALCNTTLSGPVQHSDSVPTNGGPSIYPGSFPSSCCSVPNSRLSPSSPPSSPLFKLPRNQVRPSTRSDRFEPKINPVFHRAENKVTFECANVLRDLNLGNQVECSLKCA